MKNIKYAFDDIIKRPIIFFIIIIQVLLATMILVQGLGQLFKMVDTYKMAQNVFDTKKIYRLLDKSAIENTNNKVDGYKNNQKSLYDYLVKNDQFKYCVQIDSNIIIKDFCDDDIFCYNSANKHMNNPYDNIYGNYTDIKGMYIDYNYVTSFPLKVSEGREFIEGDFETENSIPVILGFKYKGIYNVGDEFEIFDYFSKKLKSIKVIGILKPDTFQYSGGSILSLDNYVLCAFQNSSNDKTIDSDKYTVALSQGILLTDNIERDLTQIRSKSKELGVNDYSVSSASTDINKLLNNLEGIAKNSLTKSILLILFVSVGILTVQLNKIKNKTREYGIHLLLGANKNDIIIRNFIEILLHFTIGTLIGLYFEYFKNASINQYDYRIIIVIGLFYNIITVTILYFLYRKIKKMEVSTIIKDLNKE